MTEKRRRTAADYEAAADHYEAHPPTADDIRSVEIGPGLLRTGRPPKTAASSGKTPAMAIRFPGEIRAELQARVDEDHEAASESELVRVAVLEYLARHPRGGSRPAEPRFPGFVGKILGLKGPLPSPVETALAAKIVDAFEHQSARHGFEMAVKPGHAGRVIVLRGGTIDVDEFAADLTEVPF